MTVNDLTNPMHMLGKTFDFEEVIPSGDTLSMTRYRAQVLALQVPFEPAGIEWAVLLLPHGSDDADYVALDGLTFHPVH